MQLSSTISTNLKAGVYGSMAIVAPFIGTLGPDWMKWSAVIVFCVSMAVINWKTVGSGITPAEGDAIKEEVLGITEDDISAAIERARR